MPTIRNSTLTLTTVDNDVTIRVTYYAVFSPIEKFLYDKGLIFRERIQVRGENAGTASGQILHTFPLENIPVPLELLVPRVRQMKVSRASLQEDPGLGDADEIICKIEITPIGIPAVVTGFTPVGTLLG